MCGCRILVHDPWGPGGEPLVLCNLEAKGRPSPPGHLQVVAPRSPLSKEWGCCLLSPVWCWAGRCPQLLPHQGAVTFCCTDTSLLSFVGPQPSSNMEPPPPQAG